MDVLGVVAGFGLSDVFGKIPAATELGSLGGQESGTQLVRSVGAVIAGRQWHQPAVIRG